MILKGKKNEMVKYLYHVNITYLSAMFQHSVFHDITKHLYGTAKAKDTESPAHVKALE